MNLWKILEHFRDWQVCASIDGTGEIGEYIRTGLKYNQWLDHFKQGVGVMKHQRQLKLDYTLTTPGLMEIKNMVLLAEELNVELLTKVTFAFDPTILLSPMALPRNTLNEMVDEALDWLHPRVTPLTQSCFDVLTNMKNRPTFEEQWGDWAEKEMPQGKARLKNLDNIRGGNDMEYILAHDKRLLEWWNNL
jgi:hypothetical protein